MGPHKNASALGLQIVVFALVCASFTTIYLLQPVLPVLQSEFGIDEKSASLGISALILGIAVANLPFGRLSDRRPIKPIIAIGGVMVASSSVGPGSPDWDLCFYC